MNAHGIEQERRDFKRDHPTLYQYIVDHHAAVVWNMAGDSASGYNHALANQFWSYSGRHADSKRAAHVASQEALDG